MRKKNIRMGWREKVMRERDENRRKKREERVSDEGEREEKL